MQTETAANRAYIKLKGELAFIGRGQVGATNVSAQFDVAVRDIQLSKGAHGGAAIVEDEQHWGQQGGDVEEEGHQEAHAPHGAARGVVLPLLAAAAACGNCSKQHNQQRQGEGQQHHEAVRQGNGNGELKDLNVAGGLLKHFSHSVVQARAGNTQLVPLVAIGVIHNGTRRSGFEVELKRVRLQGTSCERGMQEGRKQQRKYSHHHPRQRARRRK